jgi:hypothetical protein
MDFRFPLLTSTNRAIETVAECEGDDSIKKTLAWVMATCFNRSG